jgi:hypothetical protein
LPFFIYFVFLDGHLALAGVMQSRGDRRAARYEPRANSPHSKKTTPVNYFRGPDI